MSSAPPPTPSFLPGPAADEPRPMRGLLGLAMRRPGGRRAVSAVTALLFLGGVSMFAFPAVTDLIGAARQVHVKEEFNNPQFQTLYRAGAVKVGQGLTRLVIDNPRVKVDVLVVEGTTFDALRAGAGHYVFTPYPCQRGNVAIAGHRTTYGRPFNRIDQMRPGDTVTLITPFKRCVYQVVPGFDHHSNPWITYPTDDSVVSQDGDLGTGHWLTLTSCNPKGSDAQRIILRAQLVSESKIASSTRGSS
ncbi:MAG TPA: class E sortase [Mycobacteriales bacterium]|jgi:sortase A|nr:class E sortase [Mycobacteriales bacterium]